MAEADDGAAAAVLEVAGLAAGYGGRPVVAGIDLTVRAGAILALLGGNGSGKSTLLRAVSGQIRLLAGRAAIGGADVARAPERAKAQLGMAVDPAELPRLLSGRQYLEMVASIRRCALDDWPCPDTLARLDVAAVLDRPIAECSLGTRAKLAIAGALLGAPRLLILDESLNGLDPLAAWEVKSMLRAVAATGRHAVILATHDIEAVPALCTEALLLAEGAVRARWSAAALQAARQAPTGFEGEVIAALAAARQPA